MMTAKLRALRRLATLYGKVEQLRSVQLRVASSAVDEVMRASREEAAIRRARVADGRAALVTGDRQALAVAAVEHDIAADRQRRLEQMRVSREVVHEDARTMHQASRQRMEQIDNIVEQTADQLSLEEGRRQQAAADDRYLSRRVWVERAANYLKPGKQTR